MLAAGQGKRMRSALPKVLHPLAGRPLLAHVIDAARALRPERIYVVHGHGGAEVRAAFGDARVEWVEQARQLGTGHALMQALPQGAARRHRAGAERRRAAGARRDAAQAGARRGQRASPSATSDLTDPAGYGRVVRDARRARARASSSTRTRRAPSARSASGMPASSPATPRGSPAGWPRSRTATRRRSTTSPTSIGIAAATASTVSAVKATDPREVAGVNSREELAILERAYQNAQAKRLLDGGRGAGRPLARRRARRARLRARRRRST